MLGSNRDAEMKHMKKWQVAKKKKFRRRIVGLRRNEKRTQKGNNPPNIY